MGNINKLLREGLYDYAKEGTYFHGSVYPKLSWSAAPEDITWAIEGYGLYLTPSKEQALGYAFKDGTDGYIHTLMLDELDMLDFNKDSVPSYIVEKVKNTYGFFDLFYSEPNINFDDYEFDDGRNIWSWDYLGDDKVGWAKDKPTGWFLEKVKYGETEGDYEYGLSKEEVIDMILMRTNRFNKVLDFDALYKGKDSDGMHNIEIDFDKLFDKVSTFYWYLTLKYQSIKKASYFFKKVGIDAFKVTDWEEDYINLINPSKILNHTVNKVKYDKRFRG